MNIPSAHQAIKKAGMSEVGTAAAIGALLSSVAANIPLFANLRVTNPALYDAALVAGTVQVLETFGESELQHDQSMVPTMRAV